jgi:hypothetical protein
VLTVTASSATFAYPSTTDVNDCIVLTDAAGNKYRLKITATSSTTVATAIVDNTLPAALLPGLYLESINLFIFYFYPFIIAPIRQKSTEF